MAVQLQNSDWNRAVKYIELAENEAKKTKKTELSLAFVYLTAGKMYASKDVLDVALEYYLKAYEIYKRHNNLEQASKLENNLAIIYSQGNNKAKSLKYFLNVYHYQTVKKDSVQLVKVLNNIGTLYLSKNLDSSLYYFQKAQLINKSINNNDLKVYVYTNLGRTYALKKDYRNADFYFNQAFSLQNRDIGILVKAFVYESFAEYNLQEKKYDAAIDNAKTALELYKDKTYGFSGLNLNKMLYKIFAIKEDYKNAVYYFEKYSAINDSINIEQKAVNLERIKLEEEYKVHAKIKALIEEKKRFKFYIISLVLLVGILILAILLIKYKKTIFKNQVEKEKLKSKERELKENLEAKNRVLIGKAMSEIHRTDDINEIVTDLKKVKLKMLSKETQQAIDIVLKRLEKNLNTDIWNEFELSFEQVHQSFFDKLSNEHPSLSPKDRRLCALLYLDLSTKEISKLTGKSFKTIENARARLRKKFDLTNEKVNLSTFLNTFKTD
ncbi:hypothetical protein ACFO5S_08310 [Flavobacterium branchiicola]|uniref:HTH luxR-type domain-containing protein n=2 Tax=Flavobacterium branchiicola TaxID=1114875 RepID=A0ABV9PBW8_9FLAO|nr:hypothetical protein [Flavobacterium branchiicola]